MHDINDSDIQFCLENATVNETIDKAIQEMAELTVELTKFREGRSSNVLEEAADVLIMATQISKQFEIEGTQNTQDWIYFKIQRRIERINECRTKAL